jgi:hypothetical protein
MVDVTAIECVLTRNCCCRVSAVGLSPTRQASLAALDRLAAARAGLLWLVSSVPTGLSPCRSCQQNSESVRRRRKHGAVSEHVSGRPTSGAANCPPILPVWGPALPFTPYAVACGRKRVAAALCCRGDANADPWCGSPDSVERPAWRMLMCSWIWRGCPVSSPA